MRVVLTGAGGFLGWHTRVRLKAVTAHDVVAIDRAGWPDLSDLVRGAEAVIHVAGVNRATDAEVEEGNLGLAREVADAVKASGSVTRVIFANSIQSGNGSAYGRGKAAAGALLAAAARRVGAEYADVLLPNLFGEHGRPRYNSFVATFVDAVIRGETPEVADRPVDLLHVQAAAQVLIDALTTPRERLEPKGTSTSVQSVFATLKSFHDLYANGDIPPLTTALDVALFNTLRAARFPHGSPIALAPRRDERGALVEAVRAHGGQGQTFVSTTHPAVTRGEHFHLRKVERFVVLDGAARISLRRLFTEQTVSFDVSGEHPVAVDMPTMWAHNITNTGPRDLTTLFWTSELFDASAPDTYPEPVSTARTPALLGAP